MCNLQAVAIGDRDRDRVSFEDRGGGGETVKVVGLDDQGELTLTSLIRCYLDVICGTATTRRQRYPAEFTSSFLPQRDI